MLGDGIFNSDSDPWRSQRRMAQRFPSHEKTLRFLGKITREEIEDTLVKTLDESSERVTVINLQDLFDRLSFDTTCWLVMGLDPKSLCIGFPRVESSDALNVTEEAIVYHHGFHEGFWTFQKMLRIGKEEQFGRAKEVLDERSAEIVRMKQEQLKNGVCELEEDEYMDMLKSCMLNNEAGDDDDKFLRNVILNFMVAGRDTIAPALNWFFTMLSMNPRMETKIREEIDSLMGENWLEVSDFAYLERSLPKMVYLHGAFCESLRLYLPIPFQHKRLTKPVILPIVSAPE